MQSARLNLTAEQFRLQLGESSSETHQLNQFLADIFEVMDVTTKGGHDTEPFEFPAKSPGMTRSHLNLAPKLAPQQGAKR